MQISELDILPKRPRFLQFSSDAVQAYNISNPQATNFGPKRFQRQSTRAARYPALATRLLLSILHILLGPHNITTGEPDHSIQIIQWTLLEVWRECILLAEGYREQSPKIYLRSARTGSLHKILSIPQAVLKAHQETNPIFAQSPLWVSAPETIWYHLKTFNCHGLRFLLTSTSAPASSCKPTRWLNSSANVMSTLHPEKLRKNVEHTKEGVKWKWNLDESLRHHLKLQCSSALKSAQGPTGA